MTIRRGCVVLVVLIGLAQASPARAQFVKKIMHSIAQDTKRNNCWPKPFVVPDRQSVRIPIAMMVEQGWKRQNLLGNYYFDQETNKLTEAGELKTRWMVTQVPASHRVIYVSPGQSQKDTDARMKAVQEVAAQVAGGQSPPRIYQTNLAPGGWPASRVDAIGRAFTDDMPAPVLPDYDRGDTSN